MSQPECRVARADVQRIAETYVDTAKLAIVVAGDEAKIEESLAPYKVESQKE